MKIIFFAIINIVIGNQDYWSYNTNAANSTESMNISLINQSQEDWYINISVASPPQYFTVVADTGSYFLWIVSVNCKRCSNSASGFNASKSTTYSTQNTIASYQYQSGESVSGTESTSTIDLVGSSVNQSMNWLLVTSDSGFTSSSLFDGIMGLSNNQTQNNIFNLSATNGQISSSIYGFILNPLPFNSYLIYSQIDSSIINSVAWLDSISNQYWMLNLTGVLVNGLNYSQYLDGTNEAVLATGQPQLLLNPDLYNEVNTVFWENIQQDGTYPCQPDSNYTTNITFIFDQGVNVTVNYTSLLQDYPIQDAGDQCYLFLGQSPSNYIVLGGPFFLNAVVLFNLTSNQIGLASQSYS